jgi:hypothetical protein
MSQHGLQAEDAESRRDSAKVARIREIRRAGLEHEIRQQDVHPPQFVPIVTGLAHPDDAYMTSDSTANPDPDLLVLGEHNCSWFSQYAMTSAIPRILVFWTVIASVGGVVMVALLSRFAPPRAAIPVSTRSLTVRLRAGRRDRAGPRRCNGAPGRAGVVDCSCRHRRPGNGGRPLTADVDT